MKFISNYREINYNLDNQVAPAHIQAGETRFNLREIGNMIDIYQQAKSFGAATTDIRQSVSANGGTACSVELNVSSSGTASFSTNISGSATNGQSSYRIDSSPTWTTGTYSWTWNTGPLSASAYSARFSPTVSNGTMDLDPLNTWKVLTLGAKYRITDTSYTTIAVAEGLLELRHDASGQIISINVRMQADRQTP